MLLVLSFVFLLLRCNSAFTNETLVQALIDQRADGVRSLCDAVRTYFANPSSGCQTFDACDSDMPSHIISSGGEMSCHTQFGSDEICGCESSTSIISLTNTSTQISPSASSNISSFDEITCLGPALIPHFKSVRAEDPGVKWQYLGTPDGIATFYPGHYFFVHPHNSSDPCKRRLDSCPRYDCRERPWYIASASGPKDVVLLLDTSSSMSTHSRIQILRDAAKVFVNGLGILDRIGVVSFSTNVQSCNDTLLPGTSANKASLENCIDALSPSGKTNYEKAFEKAYDLILDRSYLQYNCHTVIVFITDGVPTEGLEGPDLLQFINAGNDHDVGARIFTYSLGTEVLSTTLPQQIACDNHGIWTPIEDSSDVDDSTLREALASYYSYFIHSRRTRRVVWTERYFDFAGLGFMTTVAQGCFSDEGKFYGVVGLDVMIDEFELLADWETEVAPMLFEESNSCDDLEVTDEMLDEMRLFHLCDRGDKDKELSEDNNAAAIIGIIFGILGSILFLIILISGVILLVIIFVKMYGNMEKQKQFVTRFKSIDMKDVDEFLTVQASFKNFDEAHLNINRKLFEINYADLKVFERCGGGKNGVVFRAEWAGKIVAFKCFQLDDALRDRFEYFEQEVSILGSVSHPYVCQFFGATLHPPRVGIVMEFASNGSLTSFLSGYDKAHPEARYPLMERLRMLFEVASAMMFLHERKIIHRDIKPENVLVMESETAKLTDFGLSKVVECVDLTKSRKVGTSWFMAPEVVLGGDYSHLCDVFSFAFLFYEAITSNFEPFGAIPPFNIEYKIANDPEYRPGLLAIDCGDDSQWMRDLIQDCWAADTWKRRTFPEIWRVLGERLGKDVTKVTNQPKMPAAEEEAEGDLHPGVESETEQ